MRGKRDTFGVDPGTGFEGVRPTDDEKAEWDRKQPRRAGHYPIRSRCMRCGTRIWHSGLAVGAHRRSAKCRETAARLRAATEAIRREEAKAIMAELELDPDIKAAHDTIRAALREGRDDA